MYLLKCVLISAVIIAVLAVVIHEFSSEIMTLVSLPTFIMTLSNQVQNMVDVLGLDLFQSSYVGREAGEVPKTNAKKNTRNRPRTKDKLFTSEELWNYNGHPGSKGLYLALLGLVYNVKKGKKHYGPNGGYEFFAGRDATRAFVSGDFSEKGLIDDITGLTPTDYIGLDEWMKFYQKDYKYVGKLIGRYYDQKGVPTPYNHKAQKWIGEAYQEREDENHVKKLFPPCNSEWAAETGSRVWCTKHSGGVDREWVGVPRKLYSPGHNKPRCACVRNFGPPSNDPLSKTHDDEGDLADPNLEEYQECRPEETFCTIPNN